MILHRVTAGAAGLADYFLAASAPGCSGLLLICYIMKIPHVLEDLFLFRSLLTARNMVLYMSCARLCARVNISVDWIAPSLPSWAACRVDEPPIGWDPDRNHGVRLNIRPFVTTGVLRSKFTLQWNKDRGKNPDGSERLNDLHKSLAQKIAARNEKQVLIHFIDHCL